MRLKKKDMEAKVNSVRYVDTIEEAKKVFEEDEVLGEFVKKDVETLTSTYKLEKLNHGKCTYGGCVMILKFDELDEVEHQFQGLDYTLPEFVDIFVCDDGTIAFHLLYIYSTDYSLSIYVTKEKCHIL